MENDKREELLRRIDEALPLVTDKINELKWTFPVQTFIQIFAEWKKYYTPELANGDKEGLFKRFYELPPVKEHLELFRHKEEMEKDISGMSLEDTYKRLISLESVRSYVKYQNYYEALTYYRKKLTGLTK